MTLNSQILFRSSKLKSMGLILLVSSIGLCDPAKTASVSAHKGQVSSIQLERAGSKSHLRILVRNLDIRWNGPFTVQVLGRPLPYCPWFPIRTWLRQSSLGPGQHLCLELFDDSNALLKLLAVGPCQFKVEVASKSADGQKSRLMGTAESHFESPR
jgi:hypothetical protein